MRRERLLVLAVLAASTMLLGSVPASASEWGEWIWFPRGDGGWVYCDFFPEWSDQYGAEIDQYYCYVPEHDFWMKAKYGWQHS